MIYFDNAATTKPNAEVVALFNKVETENFGNSSSTHGLGFSSNALLNKARDVILKYFKLNKHNVYFCSSATEGNNIAIKGYALKFQNRGKHLITSTIEHPSVLECFKQLETFGFEVTYLKPNKDGIIESSELERSMRNDTILVSIMAVNNEIGSINPINEYAKIISNYPKAKLHVDATQAIGKVNLDYSNVDMFTFSGHKIHGLKNSGVLIMKKGIEMVHVISGGGQEDGLRSGTVSVAMAMSLAKALTMSKPSENVVHLHDYLFGELKKIDGVKINSPKNGSPYIVNFSSTKKKASVIVEGLSNKQIYISSVSACHSKYEPISYVVKEVTGDEKLASNTLRVSFDNLNTLEEADVFLKNLKELLETLK